MNTDETPVFRKAIVPWYDSEAACLITIIFMDLVFLFSALGISAAIEIPEYTEYIWVPGLLMAMSVLGIVSITVRLIRRYICQMRYAEIRPRHELPKR